MISSQQLVTSLLVPDERLSVLRQNHFDYEDERVIDVVIMGNEKLYNIMKEKDAIYMKEDFSDEDGVRAAELEGEFAELGGWEAESEASQLLQNLNIPEELHYQNMSELANGEKVKVLLAKALLVNQMFFSWTSRPTGWTSNLLLG